METMKAVVDSGEWNYYVPESPDLDEIRRHAEALPAAPIGSSTPTWEEYDRMFSQAPASESERLLRRLAQPRDYEIVRRHLLQQGFPQPPLEESYVSYQAKNVYPCLLLGKCSVCVPDLVCPAEFVPV